MISKITNSIISKPLAVLLAFSFLFTSFKAPDGKVVLSAGTQVRLETINTLKSDIVLPGQTIDFKVIADVVIDEKVVIAAGTLAKGQVTRAQKAKGLGKAGYLEVRLKSVTAVDGQQIYLSGSNINQEGEDKSTTAIVLGVLICLLFLTIKGSNAEVPIGHEIAVNVASTLKIATK